MDFAYQARRIGFDGVETMRGWRLKRYTILHPSRTPLPGLSDAALDTAASFLPQPPVTAERYGVGWVSVHRGASYDFVTVAYWCYQTELRSQTYMRPSSGSFLLEPLSGSELSSDVWDLRLMAFERDAWVTCVLRPDRADLDTYLERHLDEDA